MIVIYRGHSTNEDCGKFGYYTYKIILTWKRILESTFTMEEE